MLNVIGLSMNKAYRLGLLVLVSILGAIFYKAYDIYCVISFENHEMRIILQGLELFKLDNGRFPTMAEGLGALQKKPKGAEFPNYNEQGYVKSVPKDPWGRDFHYYVFLTDSGEQCAEIWTYGRSGAPLGEGEEQDVRVMVNDLSCLEALKSQREVSKHLTKVST